MRYALGILLLVFLGFRLFAAEPYVGYVYPSSMQAGTTNVLIVGGQYFWGRQLDAGFSGKGLRVLSVKLVPDLPVIGGTQKTHLNKWLDGIDRGVTNEPSITGNPYLTDWRSNTWFRTLDCLNALQRSIVSQSINVPRNPLQAAPSLRQRLLVTVVASSDATLGLRDFCVWHEGGMSPPRPFLVTRASHTSQPLYRAPHRVSAAAPTVLTLPVVFDGQIMPGETDSYSLTLEKGRLFSCKVLGRDLQPFIGDAVPGFFNPIVRLLDSQGNEIAFADDHDFHPDPILTCTIPATGFYTLEVRDNLFRGRADFVYVASCEYVSSQTSVSESANDSLIAQNLHTLSEKVALHTIACEKPGTYRISVSARSFGSLMDPLVTLMSDAGTVLGRCDDTTNSVFVGTIAQAECDPVLEWYCSEPGSYTLKIEDALGRFGRGYAYRFACKRVRPDFTLYAAKSSLCLRPYARTAIPLVISRSAGFSGALTVVCTSPDLRLEKAVVPPGVDRWNVVCVNVRTNACALKTFRLYALAETKKEPVVRAIVPCDAYDQAFAWRHLVPARSFRLKSLPLPNTKSNTKKR